MSNEKLIASADQKRRVGIEPNELELAAALKGDRTMKLGNIPHLKPNAVILEHTTLAQLEIALDMPGLRPGVSGFNEHCSFQLVSVPDWSTVKDTPLGPCVSYQQFALVNE